MRQGNLLVLCYHAVSPVWHSPMAVAPEALAAQASSLLRRGYRPTTVTAALTEGGDLREKRFAVTFDDGFASVYENAFPVLQSLGVPGTVYVLTDFVASGEPMTWPALAGHTGSVSRDDLVSMSWDQARTLAGEGWEIGSHTCSHPLLTTLDTETLDHELRASRLACAEALDRECTSFAYPQSDEDARVRERVAAAGYDWACTLPSRLAAPERYAWPRIGAYAVDGPLRFRIKSSPALLKLRTSRAGHAAERIARRLPIVGSG